MSYYDIVVMAVPTAGKDAFLAHARDMAAVFRKHGATAIVDAWGEEVPDGKLTDFKRAVAATPDETVAAGWVAWPDRKTRDAAWEKMMADPRMKDMQMPFDGKRMIYGGFAGVVEE